VKEAGGDKGLYVATVKVIEEVTSLIVIAGGALPTGCRTGSGMGFLREALSHHAVQTVPYYLRKLTLTPTRMTQADAVFTAGWDERALCDTVQICCLLLEQCIQCNQKR